MIIVYSERILYHAERTETDAMLYFNTLTSDLLTDIEPLTIASYVQKNIKCHKIMLNISSRRHAQSQQTYLQPHIHPRPLIPLHLHALRIHAPAGSKSGAAATPTPLYQSPSGMARQNAGFANLRGEERRSAVAQARETEGRGCSSVTQGKTRAEMLRLAWPLGGEDAGQRTRMDWRAWDLVRLLGSE